MTITVDHYYSLSSPWTYMGFQRFCDLIAETGAIAHHKPVKLGAIFPKTGGLPLPKRAPARQAYRMQELKRWRARLGVDLNFEPRHFPTDDALAARMVIAHREAGGDAAALSIAVLRALWAEEKNITDPATLGAIAGGLGLDGRELLAAADSPEIAARYDADTEEAFARGVFGAPSYVVGEEVFWGQDRLDFVAEALRRG